MVDPVRPVCVLFERHWKVLLPNDAVPAMAIAGEIARRPPPLSLSKGAIGVTAWQGRSVFHRSREMEVIRDQF